MAVAARLSGRCDPGRLGLQVLQGLGHVGIQLLCDRDQTDIRVQIDRAGDALWKSACVCVAPVEGVTIWPVVTSMLTVRT